MHWVTQVDMQDLAHSIYKVQGIRLKAEDG